jgi:formylglycine-generating enzyme
MFDEGGTARRLALLFPLALGACGSCGEEPPPPPADAPDAAPADAADDGPAADAPDAAPDAAEDAAPEVELRCPHDMVRVARRYCVDRFEGVIVDSETGSNASPYYPPKRKLAQSLEKFWLKERLETGDGEAQQVPLPALPVWQKQKEFQPRAVSRRGVVPQGYTSGELAALACKNAGKRLCTLDEWRTACRGERDQPFPYGDQYVAGRCNIFREGHPAVVLHGNATIGHSDPRLNQVKIKGKSLLRRTGETTSCMSEWEGDAIADMVGNIDEWIDDPEGTFVGGFFSRSKKDGCASTITGHVFGYFDYSTGVRCCMDLGARP